MASATVHGEARDRVELFGLADRLRRLAGELEGHARDLRRRAAGIGWQGAAAQAFRDRLGRRTREAQSGAGALRTAAAALEAYGRGLGAAAGPAIATGGAVR